MSKNADSGETRDLLRLLELFSSDPEKRPVCGTCRLYFAICAVEAKHNRSYSMKKAKCRREDDVCADNARSLYRE